MTAAAKPDPKDIAYLVERNLEIPTIPDVAARALTALNNPNSSAAQIASVIAKDQGLTAKVLKVSNSALYGLTREVKNLQQAAMVLGFSALRTIIVTVAAKALYKKFGLLERELWQHSVACAMACELIAKERRIAGHEEAFVCGLMHDIGKVVLNTGERTRFLRSRELCRTENITDLEAEQEVFGFTHVDVGALLVQRWDLSEHLEHAVFLHHEPELAPALAGDSEPLVNVTHVADQICYRLGYGKAFGQAAGETVDLDAFVSLGYQEHQLETLSAKIDEWYRTNSAALG
ncbi:MAG: HDOD domain-containing protein [Myxococcota bacterium]